ncbi:Sua5/YciO/YrdC/YwlC family protein [Streptomyces sp. NPDC055005]
MNAGSDMVDEDAARRFLGHGEAVVLPNPAPLTYVVAGTDPGGVNTAKGRPADQPVALWAHAPGTFTESARGMDLDAGGAELARRLLEEERITLLVPLRPGHAHPDWLTPATKEGWALLFGARWSPLLPVLEPFPVLYVSSANLTGRPPAASAEAARGMFPHTPVLDGGTSADRRATTTLRLSREGTLSLHRHGAQDRPYPTAQAYLDALRARLRSPSGSH